MADVLVKKRERKNDTVWEYRFEVASIDGKRQWITKSGFKTKGAAKEAGKQAQKLYEQTGVATKPTDMSFADFLDYWIENRCRLVCKEVTITGYEKKIRLYIKPELGKYRLTSIRKDNIQKLITDLYNKGFSRNTLTAIKGILSKCFDYAMEDDNKYILTNPCDRVIIPKTTTAPKTKTRVEPHVYVPADIMAKIFTRFPEGQPTHIPLILGYRCGLRLGEVFGLVWEDIDLDKKILAVNRQVQWYSNKKTGRGGNRREEADYGYWYFTEPKYRSYRTIDLDNETCELLKREKEKQLKAEEYYGSFHHFTRYYSEEPLIFGGVLPNLPPSPMNAIGTEVKEQLVSFVCRREDGSYISPRTLQHTSSVIHNQLDFKDFDFHSLRHTHTTMLIENGAPPVYVQNRLGHKNLDTTMNIYANHMTETFKQQGNSILNNMYQLIGA